VQSFFASQLEHVCCGYCDNHGGVKWKNENVSLFLIILLTPINSYVFLYMVIGSLIVHLSAREILSSL